MADNPTQPAQLTTEIEKLGKDLLQLLTGLGIIGKEPAEGIERFARLQLLAAAAESSNEFLTRHNAALADQVAHWRDAANVCRATLGAILDDINMKPSQHIGRFTRMSWRGKIAVAIDALDDADKEEPCKLTT